MGFSRRRVVQHDCVCFLSQKRPLGIALLVCVFVFCCSKRQTQNNKNNTANRVDFMDSLARWRRRFIFERFCDHLVDSFGALIRFLLFSFVSCLFLWLFVFDFAFRSGDLRACTWHFCHLGGNNSKNTKTDRATKHPNKQQIKQTNGTQTRRVFAEFHKLLLDQCQNFGSQPTHSIDLVCFCLLFLFCFVCSFSLSLILALFLSLFQDWS